MVSLFLGSFEIFLSVGKFVDHVLNVVDGFGLMVGFFEDLLLKFFNLILKLFFSVEIKPEFCVEQNMVISLMFYI